MPTPKTSTPKKAASTTAPKEAAHVVPPLAAATALDEASGAAALSRLAPRLATLSSRPAGIYFNVRLGSGAALGLYQTVKERNLHPALLQLQSIGQFALSTLDSLPDLARALWYVRHQLDAKSAIGSMAKLPAPLVAEATALRERMLQVLAFRVGALPAVKVRLDYIRRGSGYQDLADDLVQLGTLYHEHHALLQGLPEPYQPKDLGRAAELTLQILLGLGLKPSLDKSGGKFPTLQSDLPTLQLQLAALLEEAYDDTAAACAFVTRKDAALTAQFRPLAAIARNRPHASDDANDDPAPTPKADPPTDKNRPL